MALNLLNIFFEDTNLLADGSRYTDDGIKFVTSASGGILNHIFHRQIAFDLTEDINFRAHLDAEISIGDQFWTPRAHGFSAT